MAGLLRITLLGIFAAAGVALAVAVAINSTRPSPAEESLVEIPAVAELPATAAGPAQTVDELKQTVEEPERADNTPVSTPGDPLLTDYAAPLAAAYQPLVTAQFEFLRNAISQMQSNQRETADLVSRLQQDLPEPAEPAAPLPAPAALQPEPIEPAFQTNVELSDEDRVTLTLESSDLREVLKVLGDAGKLSILPSESVHGQISATMTDIDIPTALDAILKSKGFVARREGNVIFVGTHEELHVMEHVGDMLETRTYRLNYVSAEDMQKLITPLLSHVGSVTVSMAAEVGIGSDVSNAGGNSFAGNELIMVRDFVGVIQQIDHLVAEVDCMPPQVAIESTILSVKLDDKDELGVNFELLRQQDTIRIVSGVALNDLSSLSSGEGLKIGFLDTSLFVFLKALETIGDTNVVAAPRVMCLNKQRSEIHIGSELGYVSTTITETAATQTVEFMEVGTHLLIRPFISDDGMIRMEVHPELSTGSVRVEGGFTLPDKDVTQVTTNVICPDGATVVIGGLIREDLGTSATQIPVLGNLPVVGPAFRQRVEEIERREIIVLLTPRIVREPDLWEEGRRYARQIGDRRDVFADKMTPIGKRYYGERYVRLATAAWSAGDAHAALRYVNFGIHFDPLHQGGIELRQQILAAEPDLELGVHQHLNRGLLPWQHPLHDYSQRGWPWRVDHLDAGAVLGHVEDWSGEMMSEQWSPTPSAEPP